MACVKEQAHFYYIVLKGDQDGNFLADERIKKQFLNRALKAQEIIPFQTYAFCVTDREAHFLISALREPDVAQLITKLSQAFAECYQSVFQEKKVELIGTYEEADIKSPQSILEYCGRIHLLSAGLTNHMKDYWWSSYHEYLDRYSTGLVDTGTVLKYLDPDPRKAIQKFVLYHKKYAILK